eukprot:Nk52_evm6s233 gene=Nk52_evmTU6s233
MNVHGGGERESRTVLMEGVVGEGGGPELTLRPSCHGDGGEGRREAFRGTSGEHMGTAHGITHTQKGLTGTKKKKQSKYFDADIGKALQEMKEFMDGIPLSTAQDLIMRQMASIDLHIKTAMEHGKRPKVDANEVAHHYQRGQEKLSVLLSLASYIRAQHRNIPSCNGRAGENPESYATIVSDGSGRVKLGRNT